MAYETGTATGPADLIGKLATFATAQGWTISSETTTPSTSSYPPRMQAMPGRVFSKGDQVFGIGYSSSNIILVGATAVNGANSWALQTGTSYDTTSQWHALANDCAGPFLAYHFFAGASPNYLHVVIEKTAGVFKHFAVGGLIKHGAFTGGQYVQAVYWDMANTISQWANGDPFTPRHHTLFDLNSWATYDTVVRNRVRFDIDGLSNNWTFSDVGTTASTRYKGAMNRSQASGTGLLDGLFQTTPNEFNQITPFLPIPIAVNRAGNLTSLAGYVPDIRLVNMRNIQPGELVTIGGVEWLCFPAIQKSATWAGTISSSGNPQPTTSSGFFGYAYKRN